MKIIKCKSGNIMLVLSEIENVDQKVLKCNDVDASFEKHVPQYNISGNEILIYVDHVMEDDHYIEWILVDYGEEQIIKEFKPHEEAKIKVEYKEGMKAYSYCNKHSLWVNDNIK